MKWKQFSVIENCVSHPVSQTDLITFYVCAILQSIRELSNTVSSKRCLAKLCRSTNCRQQVKQLRRENTEGTSLVEVAADSSEAYSSQWHATTSLQHLATNQLGL